MAIVTTPTVAYAELVPAFVMAGVGMSLYFAPVANLVLSTVRRKEEGKASGVNNTIREVGGVFGVAVLASVFSAVGGYLSPQSFVDGMTAAVWVGAVAVALAGVAAVLIPPKRGRRGALGLAAGAREARGRGSPASSRASRTRPPERQTTRPPVGGGGRPFRPPAPALFLTPPRPGESMSRETQQHSKAWGVCDDRARHRPGRGWEAGRE